MKKTLLYCMLFLLSFPVYGQQSGTRVITGFDNDWYFALGDVKGAEKASYNHSHWRLLNLPHDWSIEGENLEKAPGGGNVGFFPTGTGWYRKKFDIRNYDPKAMYSVEFDGIYENSQVWINGIFLGKRPSGYVSFSYDLTPFLKKKGNVIAVRVDNSNQPNSRWYSGSGIYRHVRIVKTNTIRFQRYGVFSYTKMADKDSACLVVQAAVVNAGSEACPVTVKNVLYDSEGNITATSESDIIANVGGKAMTTHLLHLRQPVLWTLDNPALYRLASYIYMNGREVDCIMTNVGIRTIAYCPDKGFLLNGIPVKMKGVNLHHDAGAVGTAVPERVWERRLEILKSGGCNAIRTAHNPPAPEFLDLCDKLGFLVMDEAFDEWLEGKRDYSYKLYFAEWHQEDLETMVMRDRNHPSVVMWSIGNEVPDQSSAEGPVLAAKMINICHTADPTRLVTSGNDRIVADDTPASEAFLAAFKDDIVGYNYPDRWRSRRELYYTPDKQNHPDRNVVATESGGMGGLRSTYFLSRGGFRGRGDVNNSILTTGFIDTEQRWKFTLVHDYVIGDFMWTGIDYYGESWWPSKGSSSGYLDNCGFKKDGYYFFKSIWSDEPTLHILPHWNLEGKEGQIIQVVCFTNCNEVELFVNGKSYGKKTFDITRKGMKDNWYTPQSPVRTSTADLHLTWDVAYEPGEVVAVGKKDGKEIVTRVVTAGAPEKIRLTVDRDVIHACPSDVAHVTVEVLDKNGNLVPTAGNLIKYKVNGAKLIGVENGNMSDLTSVKDSEKKVYAGMCLAIIQAEGAGEITFTATSDGLEDCTIGFKAIK